MKYLILILIALSVGCGPERELEKWRVELIAPTGEVNETFIVKSYGKPYLNPWGDLRKIDSGGTGAYIRDCFRPEGWRWRIVGREE